eukprot:GILI01027064.1.p1 GENE.GILI01027064.1~~GILI01027064.1.p1  ORF type:complete len:165 (-),score=36.26 GILI01027064.1:444-938(-)
MGRVIQDLETSNVYCQILGGVGAEAFLSAAEASTNNKAARSFACTYNMAAKKSADASSSLIIGEEALTVLVSCLVTSHGGNKEGADDEWLYQLQNVQSRNPFKEANEVLHQLWTMDVLPLKADIEGPDCLAIRWARHVKEMASSADSASAARRLLVYHSPTNVE